MSKHSFTKKVNEPFYILITYTFKSIVTNEITEELLFFAGVTFN